MYLIYVPLDDRPCNVYYPQWIARLQPQIQLQVPPPELLGKKKQSAPIDRLWNWLEVTLEIALRVDQNPVGILSMEMLIYGGLLPSRLHQSSLEDLLKRLQKLRELKKRYPGLKIFASSLIMRCPTYNSAEEEPDYYAEWGASLFRWGWLQDRNRDSLLTPLEQQEWRELQQQLPAAILQDYRDRRETNLQVNLAIIELVAEGIIHFLSMPQDDAAPAGFTRLDQRRIADEIDRQHLENRIPIYPGADEVGCTLLARAFLENSQKTSSENQSRNLPENLYQNSPRIYPFYGTPIADTLIPLYEDRPVGQSVLAHIQAAGAEVALNPQEADIILALNMPGLTMQESWEQTTKDSSYDDRNWGDFCDRIGEYLNQGKAVALADIAFANGGETECIQRLDQAHLLDRLVAYGGWNTCGNTLGTVIATALLGWRSSQRDAITFNLLSRLWEDWLYQSIVRQHLIRQYLPTIGASYYEFAQQDQAIAEETSRCLQQQWSLNCQHSFQNYTIESLRIQHPWGRMFEIHLDLHLQRRTSG